MSPDALDFLPYGRPWIDADDLRAVEAALKSGMITTGPQVKAFEAAVERYTGAAFATAVSSGTAALHAAFACLNLKAGEEVIVPALSFVASANAVRYVGAMPIFVDIDDKTLNLNPALVEKAITPRTRAILAVDFTGLPADLARLADIAHDQKLYLVEDAAHSFGAVQCDHKVGAIPGVDLTTLSFHPVKAITTGEGGMVLTPHENLHRKLQRFRHHGLAVQAEERTMPLEGPWHQEMVDLGFNYRLTDFQCALGVSQLAKLDRFLDKRRDLVERYGQVLKDLAGCRLPSREPPDTRSAWHLFVIRLEGALAERRREVVEHLKKRGIGTQVHYRPIPRQPYYHTGGAPQEFPVANRYYREALSLPLFPAMRFEDVDRVGRALWEAVA